MKIFLIIISALFLFTLISSAAYIYFMSSVPTYNLFKVKLSFLLGVDKVKPKVFDLFLKKCWILFPARPKMFFRLRLAALGTNMYLRLASLVTEMIEGWQPWLQEGTVGLSALVTSRYLRHAAFGTKRYLGLAALGT